MSAIPRGRTLAPDIVELRTGDRMSRAEFHRAYERMPPGFKAELIGGTVYVAPPLKRRHGTNHLPLGSLFHIYELHTLGVEAGDNTTILLGDEGEPQPDLYLRILPEYGGQSHTTDDDYVEGAPELIAEVAHSSRAIDLHAKRDDYTRYGVREYLVLCLRERQLRWFDLTADRELAPDADGIFRIRCFPGLWIDSAALLNRDRRELDVLQQGLATPVHAAFVQALEDAKAARGRRGKRSPRPGRGKRGRKGGSTA
jgi:Uma2 family endonuclease